MNEVTTIADEVFAALPIEAQRAFTSRWNEALGAAIARRGPIPDPEHAEAVSELVKLFYVHGYAAGLKAEKKRFSALKSEIEAKLNEMRR